jgi:hypothetical protein
MIAVIAGNMRQFEDWCRENNRHPRDPELLWVSSPEKLRGRFNLTFVWYGLWYERRDADELREIVYYMQQRDKHE